MLVGTCLQYLLQHGFKDNQLITGEVAQLHSVIGTVQKIAITLAQQGTKRFGQDFHTNIQKALQVIQQRNLGQLGLFRSIPTLLQAQLKRQ